MSLGVLLLSVKRKITARLAYLQHNMENRAYARLNGTAGNGTFYIIKSYQHLDRKIIWVHAHFCHSACTFQKETCGLETHSLSFKCKNDSRQNLWPIMGPKEVSPKKQSASQDSYKQNIIQTFFLQTTNRDANIFYCTVLKVRVLHHEAKITSKARAHTIANTI